MPHASIMITIPILGDFFLAQGGPIYPYPELPPKEVSRTPLPRNFKILRSDGTWPSKSLCPRPASRRMRRTTTTTKREERRLGRRRRRRRRRRREEQGGRGTTGDDDDDVDDDDDDDWSRSKGGFGN